MTPNSTPTGAAPGDRDDAMRAELLRYLREHPRAMDSLEGVVEWWLPRHHIRINVERVADALERLTQDGLVEQVNDGNRVLYRVRGSLAQDE